MSGLTLATGLLAVGLGVIAGRHTIRDTHRLYRRTAGLASVAEAGWRDWFFSGFSGMTLGVRWIFAAGIWLAWTLAGLSLIGLGIGLFRR